MADVQQMLSASKLLGDVNLLSVSVDPQYDTPAILSSYAESFGADDKGWSFITGQPGEIEHLVVDGFKTAIGERKETAPGAFDIAHSSKLAVVDRFGAIRGYYSVAGSAEERKTELERLYNMLFTVMRAEAGDP